MYISKDEILIYLKEASKIPLNLEFSAKAQPPPKHKEKVWLDSQPRILMPLSGTKNYTTSDGNISLHRGDILFSPQGGWTISNWNNVHKLLSIIFWKHMVRIIYYNHKDTGVLRDNPDIYYHTQYPIQGLGKSILSALLENKQRQSTRLHLLRALLELTYDFVEKDVFEKNGKAWNTWQAVNNYIHENCNLTLSRETIATAFKIHPVHISRLCRKFTNTSYKDYTTKMRLKNSVYLLKTSRQTINEVAFHCGYEYSSHFVKVFKSYYAMTPSEYRQKFKE